MSRTLNLLNIAHFSDTGWESTPGAIVLKCSRVANILLCMYAPHEHAVRSRQACGVVLPFAIATSICRSRCTICSGLHLFVEMIGPPPQVNPLSFSLGQKNRSRQAGAKSPTHNQRLSSSRDRSRYLSKRQPVARRHKGRSCLVSKGNGSVILPVHCCPFQTAFGSAKGTGPEWFPGTPSTAQGLAVILAESSVDIGRHSAGNLDRLPRRELRKTGESHLSKGDDTVNSLFRIWSVRGLAKYAEAFIGPLHSAAFDNCEPRESIELRIHFQGRTTPERARRFAGLAFENRHLP